jgi:hypothetical protein
MGTILARNRKQFPRVSTPRSYIRRSSPHKQGYKEPLQEYIKRFAKARARAPHVQSTTVIDAAIDGLKVGPCGEYLD